jgi:hypothetical protein
LVSKKDEKQISKSKSSKQELKNEEIENINPNANNDKR